MADEEKKEETTPPAPSAENIENVDYKAELERLQKEHSQAQHNIVELRKKLKDKEETEEEVVEDIDEKVTRLVGEKVVEIRREVFKDRTDSLVDQLATSSEEAALIRWHLANSVSPSGDPKTDVERAQVLANAPAVKAKLQEAKRLVDSKNSMGGGGGPGQKLPVEEKPKELTDEEQRLAQGLARFGVTPEDIQKAK